MPYHHVLWPAAVAFVVWCGTPATPSRQPAATPQEAAFLAESDAAMKTMMNGMTIRPSGDIDQDFAAMMIAHHQGAIDMASAELRHGGNELLRRISQEIIVDQTQEIAAMRLAIGARLSPSGAAPDAVNPSPTTATPARSGPGQVQSARMRGPRIMRPDLAAKWEFVR